MLGRHRREIVLVVIIVLAAAAFVRWVYIPSFSDRHVAISEERYSYDVGEPGPWFSAWSVGDGQAYALIALDPTGEKLAQEIPEAGYRFARGGYGWAVAAVSLRRPDFVPYALAIVGAVSVVGCLLASVRLRARLGPRGWLIVLNPALFLGFAGDTSEPMGILLLTLSLGWASWVAPALLGVTRPTFLVSLWGRWRLMLAGALAALALGLYGLVMFGSASMVPSGGRLGAPLAAYFEHPTVSGALLAVLALTTVIVGVRTRDLSWVLAGVFVLSFGSDVLRDPINAWRAAGFLPVLWAFGTRWVPPARRERILQSQSIAADVA